MRMVFDIAARRVELTPGRTAFIEVATGKALKQEMTFLEPVAVGVPLTATVEITRLRPDKQLVDLATTCTTPDGRVLCQGRALVLVIDVTG